MLDFAKYCCGALSDDALKTALKSGSANAHLSKTRAAANEVFGLRFRLWRRMSNSNFKMPQSESNDARGAGIANARADLGILQASSNCALPHLNDLPTTSEGSFIASIADARRLK